MRTMLALLVFIIGLEGVDRAMLQRAMDAKTPPREPLALRALLDPPPIPVPPPPPPPPIDVAPGDWMFA